MLAEYYEDYADHLTETKSVGELSSVIRTWIEQKCFVVFHGTRLAENEVERVATLGLQKLIAADREARLAGLLSQHPRWTEVEHRLPKVIEELGPNEVNGCREGQVHFSLSRAGLVESFNYYLVEGPEFDKLATTLLFGDHTGINMIRDQTAPFLVKVRLSGSELIAGSHAIISYDDVSDMGEIPGLALAFLNTWAYLIARPEVKISSLRTDSCLMLQRNISPSEIIDIEPLEDWPHTNE